MPLKLFYNVLKSTNMKISQIRDPFSAVTTSGSGRNILVFIIVLAMAGYTYYNFIYQPNKK